MAVRLLRTEFPHLYQRCIDDARTYADITDPQHVTWVGLGARQLAAPRLLSNRAQCRACGQEIESTHRHDYVTCSCGSVSVDGGPSYLRRAWSGTGPGFEELLEYETLDAVRERLAGLPEHS